LIVSEHAASGDVTTTKPAETMVQQGQAGDAPAAGEEAAAKNKQRDLITLFNDLPRFGANLFSSSSTAGNKPANTPVSPNYIVGPGDKLTLQVWAQHQEQVNESISVTPDGYAVFPQVGKLTVAGESLLRLRQTLDEAYREFYADPTVTLVLSEQRVVEVYVTGDVQRPGRYELPGMATVLSALYAAGGPSPIGSYRKLRVTRPGQPAIEIDLYDYLLNGNCSAEILLQPGDTIFVPAVVAEAGVTGSVKRPGRYELASRGPTVVKQLLDMAGGFAPTAYKSSVELWRPTPEGQWQLVILDCSHSDSRDLDFEVRNGDLLIVHSVLAESANTVELKGAVKRPGYYPVGAGTTLSSVLKACGGLTIDAHMGTGIIYRLNADNDYEVVPFDVRGAISGGAAAAIALRSHDIIEIFSQEQVEPACEVTIEGAVRHPGTYQWAEGMRVSQLVLQAGGLAAGAYTKRANLLRLTATQKRRLIPVDVAAALAGDLQADLVLERGDVLQIIRQEDAVPGAVVHVNGLVQKPGEYPRYEQMRASDLIFAAGGLLPGAGPTVELVRGHFEGVPSTVTLRLVGGPDDWHLEPDPCLRDDDCLSVIGRGTFQVKAGMVTLKGSVRRPGSYAIRSGNGRQAYTVWDLLQEAGGLLDDANPDGIVVYRRRSTMLEPSTTEELRQVVQAVNRTNSCSREGVAAAVDEESVTTGNEVSSTSAMQATVARELAKVLGTAGGVSIVLPPQPVQEGNAITAIPVDGGRLMRTGGKSGNVRLEDGDTVVVPRRVDSVMVLGAVTRCGAVSYQEGYRCRDYIRESGGLREDAAVKHMVVIHANGSAAPITIGGRVRPGDIIVVPTRHIVYTVRTEPAWQKWLQSIVSVATAALIY